VEKEGQKIYNHSAYKRASFTWSTLAPNNFRTTSLDEAFSDSFLADANETTN
jgi:hypothetical protein